MAPHSSPLAWKSPWTEEPRGLQFMGSLRVGHNRAASLSLSRTAEGNGNALVFLPGESQGRGSLVGRLLSGRTELDTTEGPWQQQGAPKGNGAFGTRMFHGFHYAAVKGHGTCVDTNGTLRGRHTLPCSFGLDPAV